jgi:hypothetical protein
LTPDILNKGYINIYNWRSLQELKTNYKSIDWLKS